MKMSPFYCNQTLSKKCFVLLFAKPVCNFQSIHWSCDVRFSFLGLLFRKSSSSQIILCNKILCNKIQRIVHILNYLICIRCFVKDPLSPFGHSVTVFCYYSSAAWFFIEVPFFINLHIFFIEALRSHKCCGNALSPNSHQDIVLCFSIIANRACTFVVGNKSHVRNRISSSKTAILLQFCSFANMESIHVPSHGNS